MRNILLVALLALSFTTSAGEFHNYYPSKLAQMLKTNASSEEVKSYVFSILNSTHQRSVEGKADTLGCERSKGQCYSQRSLGYKGARKVLFGKLHLEKDGEGYYIKDVYCRKEFRRRHTRMGPGQIPNSNLLNCEHTWPQSKFSRQFGKDLQKSDLHHLYPTDSHANSVRGNYDFGDVNGYEVDQDCTASRTQGRGGRFEPPTEHKGNVARALFYFAVRYNMTLSSNVERTLREWHIQDPVDATEVERNELIYKVQNNRNPFIDIPELVDTITNF